MVKTLTLPIPGIEQRLSMFNIQVAYVPEFQFCTDNAGMISVAGYYHYLESEFTDLSVSSEARSISF